MEVAEEIEVNQKSIEVDEIQCGSVNVSMTIYNVTNADLENKLVQVILNLLSIDKHVSGYL